MEFKNRDSNADKIKLYERVRKGLAEMYQDQPEAFDPASVSENTYKIQTMFMRLTSKSKEEQVKVKGRKGTNKKRIFSCP